MAKYKRRIYCKFCDYFCYDPDDYASHLEKHHDELIPVGMSAWQFSYYLRTNKTHGNCIICHAETSWNEKTHKYNRFCPNPKCKEKYREVFKKRMIGKYGKTTLLNDPEQQRKMLAGRRISGKYLWRDHVHETSYTGSYEKDFLMFLDRILEFLPSDIMAPSPHTYYYMYKNEKHFYIPDFFIPSLDLEIEIKDGGDNPNLHHKIQDVDKVKEKCKDEVMTKNHFNYVKIVNKDYKPFFKMLEKLKENFFDSTKKDQSVTILEQASDVIYEDNMDVQTLYYKNKNTMEVYTESVALQDIDLYYDGDSYKEATNTEISSNPVTNSMNAKQEAQKKEKEIDKGPTNPISKLENMKDKHIGSSPTVKNMNKVNKVKSLVNRNNMTNRGNDKPDLS